MSGRVLVVDDETEIRRALRTGLGYHGFDVRVVPTGEEALRELAGWHPDVVLLDLMLPGIDGFEVLGRLREQTRSAVIALSVMPGQHTGARGRSSQPSELPRPFRTFIRESPS